MRRGARVDGDAGVDARGEHALECDAVLVVEATADATRTRVRIISIGVDAELRRCLGVDARAEIQRLQRIDDVRCDAVACRRVAEVGAGDRDHVILDFAVRCCARRCESAAG